MRTCVSCEGRRRAQASTDRNHISAEVLLLLLLLLRAGITALGTLRLPPSGSPLNPAASCRRGAALHPLLPAALLLLRLLHPCLGTAPSKGDRPLRGDAPARIRATAKRTGRPWRRGRPRRLPGAARGLVPDLLATVVRELRRPAPARLRGDAGDGPGDLRRRAPRVLRAPPLDETGNGGSGEGGGGGGGGRRGCGGVRRHRVSSVCRAGATPCCEAPAGRAPWPRRRRPLRRWGRRARGGARAGPWTSSPACPSRRPRPVSW